MSPTRLATVVAVALFVWLALDLLVLLVAGILLAILLRAAAALVAERSGLSIGRSLALVVLTVVGLLATAAWFSADRLAQQADELAQTIPAAFADLTSWLTQYQWGRWLLDQTQSASTDGNVLQRASTMFGRVTSGVLVVVVIVFTGGYLAARPEPYIRGLLRLVPLARRQRAAEVMYAAGEVLRWWLFGQLLAMLMVGLAMGIGLAIIGVQLAFVLGVLAGLFEFIPFLGPLIGLGPALLLAMAEEPHQALYVLGLYAAVQTFEGYLLTPLVQQRAVELPPVVTITSQVALSWMAGPIGLLVAVPVTAVVMVATQMLYVRDVLGDDIEPEWESTARRRVAFERTRSLREVLPARAAAA